jgi:hypothetical protein
LTPDQVKQSKAQYQKWQQNMSQQSQTPPSGFNKVDPNKPPPAPKGKRFNNKNATDVNFRTPSSGASQAANVKPAATPQLPAPTQSLPPPNIPRLKESSSNHFARLEKLLESVMLDEAISASDWLKKYIKNSLAKLDIPDQDFESSVGPLADQFAKEYSSTGKFPTNTASKIASAVQSLTSLYQAKAKTNDKSSGQPTEHTKQTLKQLAGEMQKYIASQDQLSGSQTDSSKSINMITQLFKYLGEIGGPQLQQRVFAIIEKELSNSTRKAQANPQQGAAQQPKTA